MDAIEIDEKLQIAIDALLAIYVSDPTWRAMGGWIDAYEIAETVLKKLGIECPVAELERRGKNDGQG